VKRNAVAWANGFLEREGSSNRILADPTGLYRIRWSGALLSDICNLARAIDAAVSSAR
jgi:hypothetical protein